MISRKRMLIMFGTVLIAILLSNVFGYSSSNHKPTYGITTSNVNLRKSPTISSSTKIKTISKNTKIKIVGQISDFYIIQTTTNDIGLVSKTYVKSSTTAPSGAKTYTNLSKYYATVNGNSTNLRGGPSTSYKSYTKLSKNTKVQVIGKIDNWNVVVTENNIVGMIREDLITKVSNTTSTPSTNTPPTSSNTTSNANVIINLINNARKANNLPLLSISNALNNVAQTKSNDMVKNNYFSHTSPSYGSPFKMMQGFGISYTSAGENIAGNPSLNDAVTSWLNSSEHKKNILSPNYNYIGVGVTKSNTYGYVISAMFIQDKK